METNPETDQDDECCSSCECQEEETVSWPQCIRDIVCSALGLGFIILLVYGSMIFK